MVFEIIENYEPEQGPPKPLACVDGIESHVWDMFIEEGQVTLIADCHLCTEGITAVDPEAWASSEPFRVRLSVQREAGQPCYGIDPHWWIDIQATREDQ